MTEFEKKALSALLEKLWQEISEGDFSSIDEECYNGMTGAAQRRFTDGIAIIIGMLKCGG